MSTSDRRPASPTAESAGDAAETPPAAGTASDRTGMPGVTAFLWPLAILTALHRIVILAVDGSVTNDFAPVYEAVRRFRASQDVYTADYHAVDPHYLYSPAATLLLSPFSLFDYETARFWFVTVNLVAILAALWLLLRMFGFGPTSVAAPITLLAAFFSESIVSTLVYSNINGVVFLCEVLFFHLLLRGRGWLAGVPMGLTLAIKPIMAPLLLLPLVRGRWQPLVGSAVIPLVALGIAWPLSADPMAYIDRTLPYLSVPRAYYNSSLTGVGLYYGVPGMLVLAIQALVAVMVAVSLYLLWLRRDDDEQLWLLTSSGVMLAGIFLLGSLGQMYYSILLFPLLFTIVQRSSYVRTWAMGLAVYGFMTLDIWGSPGGERVHMWDIQVLRPTVGWFVCVTAVFAVAVWRWADRRWPARGGGRGAAPEPDHEPAPR